MHTPDNALELNLRFEDIQDYAFIVSDPEGTVVEWQGGAERITGFTVAEAVGQKAHLIFTPEDVAAGQLEREMATAARTGQAEDKRWLQKKDGSRFFANGVMTALRDEAGKLLGFRKVFRDETDRMMAEAERQKFEERLRESEERFRALVTATSEVVYRMSPDWTEMWHLEGREFIADTREPSQTWLDKYIPADERRRVSEIIRAAIRDKATFELEHQVLQVDGSVGWTFSRAIPILSPGGDIVEWFGAASDVTGRKHMEETLRAQSEQLREAHRRKDEFLGILAHELRNPLAPLGNGLQIMRLARSNAEVVDKAQSMMERQLAQMVRLIDDLLDVSRISQGKIALKMERAKLATVVQQAVETSRPLLEQGGHDLMIDLPPQPIFVNADMTRLAQVFSNLLNNAAKFTDRGGHVWLTVGRQDGDAVVSVRDTGIGIPAPMLPKIFDLFMQVDRSLEKSQGGLGIGLSLVKGLVEMHSGSVEAHSEGQGMGSEFVIRLPVAPSLAEEQPPEAPEARAAATGRRVLVVDDNRDAAASLAMMLELLGHEVRTAHDGLEALDVAAAYRPDLILLDIGMPKLNGYDACRRIRQQPWSKNVVLVALTGWGQEEDRRRSHEAGFDHHMVKPMDPQALMKLLAGLQVRA